LKPSKKARGEGGAIQGPNLIFQSTIFLTDRLRGGETHKEEGRGGESKANVLMGKFSSTGRIVWHCMRRIGGGKGGEELGPTCVDSTNACVRLDGERCLPSVAPKCTEGSAHHLSVTPEKLTLGEKKEGGPVNGRGKKTLSTPGSALWELTFLTSQGKSSKSCCAYERGNKTLKKKGGGTATRYCRIREPRKLEKDGELKHVSGKEK